MTFWNNPDLEKLATTRYGRRLWRLNEPLTYSGNYSREMGINITVPSGFVTDFASVPLPLWRVFPPFGEWNRAAIIHDYLCESKTCSRFLADAIFRECMRELGVPFWRRVTMYWAVRAYSICRGLR